MDAQEGFTLRSSAFAHGQSIPDRYTCRGANISPPLEWEGPPAGTAGFALIVEDPDTPFGTVTHWVVCNIPAGWTELEEGLPGERFLADGVVQGRNGMRRFGYMGPCPPWGRHRYVFRLLALDRIIESDSPLGKKRLLRAIDGHVLGQAELMGTYARRRTASSNHSA